MGLLWAADVTGEEEDVAVRQEVKPDLTEIVGDWYFALDGKPPKAGRSSTPWRERFRAGDHALFTQAASDHWVGHRFQVQSDERGLVWLFADRPVDPEDVARVAWQGGDPAMLGGRIVLAQRSTDGELTLTTDRLGTLHAYRGQKGFGTSMAAIGSHSGGALDERGLAGFFAFGFFPDDRTYYPDIRVFRPARRHRLKPSSENWSSERYWTWHHQPMFGRSYNETLEEFCRLFVKLMEEIDDRAEGLAIPISGGLDSRLTLAALADRKEQRWAYSYGYGPRSVETRIARRLADCRRLPFDSFQVRPYLADREDDILAAVEGFQDVTQTRQAFVADELRRHADSVVAAHWGDVWLDDMGLAGKGSVDAQTSVDHTLGRLLKRGRKWLLDHLCGPSADRSEVMLEEWVSRELATYDTIDDADFRIKAFKTDQWSWRWTVASLRAYQLGTSPRLPFYDPRLVDFFVTVPTEYVAGRRLEIDAIKRLAPDLARVPWQTYDASLYTWQYFNTLLLPKRAVKKAWRLLRRERVIERNWEVQFLHPEGRDYLADRLTKRGLRLHTFVSPKAVDSLLDVFWADPDAANGYTVSMLLTFALWLERQ